MENSEIIGTQFVFGPEKLSLRAFNRKTYWETDQGRFRRPKRLSQKNYNQINLLVKKAKKPKKLD